jgi:hypothetical protein
VYYLAFLWAKKFFKRVAVPNERLDHALVSIFSEHVNSPGQWRTNASRLSVCDIAEHSFDAQQLCRLAESGAVFWFERTVPLQRLGGTRWKPGSASV